MAPMTRGRANQYGVPGELVAEYYPQRAGAGRRKHRRGAACAGHVVNLNSGNVII